MRPRRTTPSRARSCLAAGTAAIVVLLTAGAVDAAPQTLARVAVSSSDTPVVRAGSATTIEATRPTLGELSRTRAVNPSAENERRLAFEYVTQGILDAAFDHFQAALRLDPHDGQSHEGIARIWREWGFPALGLSSAYRAVYWLPESASAQNTLGTLLLKLDLADAAADRFERARQLDPAAAYPLNNLCYLALGRGRSADAVEWCRAAAAADTTSEHVRNNFALALATAGDLDGALDVLDASPQIAVAAYNQGVLLLAARQTDRARAALMRARTSDPTFAPALRLLTQLAVRRAGS